MDRELTCDIVKDLLPLYVDGMVSDVSKKSIENHLENCSECSEVYKDMAFQLVMETQPTEVQDVKRFLKKTKKMYLLYGFGGICLTGLLVCLIVDLAVNRGLTWSLITGVSCLFAFAFIYVIANCKRNKGCIAMAVISIGTFCLLSVIQFTVYYRMQMGTFWIFSYGLPILMIWLFALWMPVLTKTFLKWNIWDCLALFMILLILGNYATRIITGEYIWDDVFHLRGFISNALGEIIGAILFVIIGIIARVKNNRSAKSMKSI